MMKKQAIFFVGWDILFIGQMYLFSKFDLMLRNLTKKSMEFNHSFWFQVGWMILVGIIIGILVYKGSQFQENRKSAILELIIIGIPAAYIATAIAILYSLSHLMERLITIGVPFWLIHSKTPALIAGIVLGYEIFIFIVRISKKHDDG